MLDKKHLSAKCKTAIKSGNPSNTFFNEKFGKISV